MKTIPGPRTTAQYVFLFIYLAALYVVLYMNSVSAAPLSESQPLHPLEPYLKGLSEPPSEPWSESFIVNFREVYPVRGANTSRSVEKFAYLIPSEKAASIQLLLVVHLDGRAARVIPLKINAPFGFAEEFIQQQIFFESFSDKKADEILPIDEGGVIPTVTGAVILSRQVIYAVREGVEFYLAHRENFQRFIRAEEEAYNDPAVEIVISTPPETQEEIAETAELSKPRKESDAAA